MDLGSWKVGFQTAAVVGGNIGVGFELKRLLGTVNCQRFSHFFTLVVDYSRHIFILLSRDHKMMLHLAQLRGRAASELLPTF
jgi:hypothetical protein